jgi:hypothetical protein
MSDVFILMIILDAVFFWMRFLRFGVSTMLIVVVFSLFLFVFLSFSEQGIVEISLTVN